MQIHRSAHTRDFTVLSNSILKDRRLSFSARGLLCHLLSLPDDSPETIRSLAENNPDGRQGIAKAFDELKRHGYFRVVRRKDPTTGQITTFTSVFDVPQDPPEPVATDPGRRGGGKPGRHPSGKNPGEEPTLPAPAARVDDAEDVQEFEEQPVAEPPPPPEPAAAVTAAAGILFRLAEVEPRLRLSLGEAAALAPLAEQWLARGATERDLRSALLPGLPVRIHRPAGLLRTRLQSKMPPPPAPKAAVRERHECAECRAPVPLPGICRVCAGVALRPDTTGFVASARRGAAAARAAMWGASAPVRRPVGPALATTS